MTSRTGRYPSRDAGISANFSLWRILSFTSAILRSPSTISNSANTFPCRCTSNVRVRSSGCFPSAAATLSNVMVKLQFPQPAALKDERCRAPLAIGLAGLLPGKVTDQLFLKEVLRCSSKSGSPEASRNSRQGRSLNLRPVAV